MNKNIYNTISKTAEIIGVRSHVLRFWEKKFKIINPKKGSSGRRFYSNSDIKNLLVIKKLLYTDGFTIKGAINYFDEKNKNKQNSKNLTDLNELVEIQELLKDSKTLISKHI